MRDLETENLLYKYFSSDVGVGTENLCSFEFEPVIFTAAGEVKTLYFIPKLSGSVNVHVQNSTGVTAEYRLTIYDDEGRKLIENMSIGSSGGKATFNVSPFHKYTIELTCRSLAGETQASPTCKFSARVVTKSEAYAMEA